MGSAGQEGQEGREGQGPRVPLLSWAWWFVAGAAIGLGIASLLTIGIFVLPLGVALLIVGARASRLRNRSAAMTLAGAAAAPLLIAWLNRAGPGTVCQSNADGGLTCDQEWSPWPFVIVAVLLLAAGVLVARRPVRADPTP